MTEKPAPICYQLGPCHASKVGRGGFRRCTLLTEGYADGEKCPFQKPVADITDGHKYPYDNHYGEKRGG